MSKENHIKNVLEQKEMYKLQREIKIQSMINDYLKEKGLETVTEKLKKEGKREILGILTLNHIIALQEMIHEYAEIMGINLKDEIIASCGEGQLIGKLSKIEEIYMNEMLTNYINELENKKHR